MGLLPILHLGEVKRLTETLLNVSTHHWLLPGLGIEPGCVALLHAGCQPKTFLTFFFDGETFLTFLFF